MTTSIYSRQHLLWTVLLLAMYGMGSVLAMPMRRCSHRFVTEHAVGQTVHVNGSILQVGEYYVTITVSHSASWLCQLVAGCVVAVAHKLSRDEGCEVLPRLLD